MTALPPILTLLAGYVASKPEAAVAGGDFLAALENAVAPEAAATVESASPQALFEGVVVEGGGEDVVPESQEQRKPDRKETDAPAWIPFVVTQAAPPPLSIPAAAPAIPVAPAPAPNGDAGAEQAAPAVAALTTAAPAPNARSAGIPGGDAVQSAPPKRASKPVAGEVQACAVDAPVAPDGNPETIPSQKSESDPPARTAIDSAPPEKAAAPEISVQAPLSRPAEPPSPTPPAEDATQAVRPSKEEQVRAAVSAAPPEEQLAGHEIPAPEAPPEMPRTEPQRKGTPPVPVSPLEADLVAAAAFEMAVTASGELPARQSAGPSHRATPLPAELPERASGKPALAFGARLVEARPNARPDTVQPAGSTQQPRPSDPDPQSKPETPRPRAARAEPGPEASDRPEATETRPAPPAARTVEPVALERPQEPAADRTEAPKPAARVAAPPEAPKASPIARDIRLEVAAADRKVEVRMVERAGEVQLAVRTPDDGLAGALREHLPLLSSRLEQSGFHADQWRAAEAPGVERRLDVRPSSESAGQPPDHRGGGGEREQRDDTRRPQPPEERRQAKQKGTAFEWLMQSLR